MRGFTGVERSHATYGQIRTSGNTAATSMKILRTVYGEKPVHETWRTPTMHYSLYVIISSMFRRYLRIVYSGLKNYFLL